MNDRPPAGHFLAGTINSRMSRPEFRAAHVFLRRIFVNDLSVPAFTDACFAGPIPKDREKS